jgi:sulfur carrier protein ThiS adenylyltransferase
MRIKVNERFLDFEEPVTLFVVRKKVKPDADVLIVNGFPVADERPLGSGDEVVLIKRGEIPSPDEFEALITARHTPGVHRRLKDAVVGIAGLGGLGSGVAVALARLGVGEMVLADYDVVEPSNLNRQQYFTDQIGMSKVGALTGNLKRINPYVKLRGCEVLLDSNNVTEIFQGVQVLVEAFDSAEAKAMLINRVVERMPEVFVVAVSGLAGFGPSEEIAVRRFSERCFIVGDGITAAEPGVGLMSPRVGVAAHHQANLVLRILLDEEGKR